MPTINTKICRIHGIHNDKKCKKCISTKRKEYDKNYRNKESKDFYNSNSWKETRSTILRNNPFCKICKLPAQTVDHIIPISENGHKTKENNLQSLCISCHNKKTRFENYKGGYKNVK